MTLMEKNNSTGSGKSTPTTKQETESSVVLVNNQEKIPISSEVDMMVPVSFAMMKHDFSKIQIRTVINIIKKLQPDLKRLFSMGNRRAIINSYDNSLALVFSESENVDTSTGKYDIIFKMNELNLTTKNYNDLEQSLIHMADIPVQMPYKIKGSAIGEKEEIIEFTNYTHLCDVKISERRYRRIVIFSFSPEVAEKFISTDFGYLKLYDSVIMKSSNRYTQLVYMLLSQFKDKKFIRIKTKKLRERLNITEKYKEFRLMKYYVLEPAMDNLAKMFKSGESDLSFTYECEYTGKTTRGVDPEFIKIHIIKRVLISQEDYQERVRYSRTMVEKWLRITFKMTDEKKICKYISLTTPENYLEVQDKFNYIYSIITDPKKSSKIVDKRAYILSAIDNLFKEISDITDVE